ncbi:MAG: alpha/beta fold hydrolase [Acidimicrobiia bacterium]|nr:alpha/beta fold hydrolase [Acidimicrobiia bacterium]
MAQTDLTEQPVHLPGRGTTWIRRAQGPRGAPTLVLLHGLAATARLNWGPAFGPLAGHFDVVGIDQRGHGRGIRTDTFRLADCADDVVALADTLGIDRFTPVGYSMGGPIAQLTWHRHRDRVASLVLCATSGHFLAPRWQRGSAYVLPGLARLVGYAPNRAHHLMQERLLAGVNHPRLRDLIRREMAGTDPAAVMQAAGACARFSSHAWVGDIDVPTAVLVMTEDDVVSPHRQRSLAARIPLASVHEVPGDHVVCATAPDVFVPALVNACLDATSRGQAAVTAPPEPSR